jgi:hypothetical protein
MTAEAKRRIARASVAILIVAVGLCVIFARIERSPRLLDQDEAACIFAGYYLETFLDRDFKNENWHAFDKYAEHPPVGGYLFGSMLHVISEPMKSAEPRRFWFEHTFDPDYYPHKFFDEISKRYSYHQLISARTMSAGIAFFTALFAMLMMKRLFGLRAALAFYALLVSNPLYAHIGRLATYDIFILLLMVCGVWIAQEIATATALSRARATLFALALAAVIGVGISTKISFFSVIPLIFLPAVFLAGDRRKALRRALIVAAAIPVGLLIGHLLDPASYGHFFGTIAERIRARSDMIGIQRTLFFMEDLKNPAERAGFDLYEIFFWRQGQCLAAILSTLSLAYPFFFRGNKRKAAYVFSIAGVCLFFTFFMTPLAWVRYAAQYLPFIMMPAGLGFCVIFYILGNFRQGGQRFRIFSLILFLILIILVHIASFLLPILGRKPPPSPQRIEISRKFAWSLTHPGEDPNIHKELYNFFVTTGDIKQAKKQADIVEKMGVK